MDISTELTQWLRKMGYSDQIPNSLSCVVNSSTYIIWNQLMTNIKPKQEVEICKANVIFNRLKTTLKTEDEQFPVKEIDLYRKKKELEKNYETLQRCIKEKETKVETTSIENKIKYMHFNSFKESLQEKREKIFLLNEKIELLRMEIEKQTETLSLIKNLTPVESETESNHEKVTELLHKCAIKLESHMKNGGNYSFKKPNIASTSKKCHNQEHSVLKSSKKLHVHDLFYSCNVNKTKKCLYSARKNNGREDSLLATTILPFDTPKVKVGKPRRKERESLGILPDSCLELDFSDDTFLTSTSKSNNGFGREKLDFPYQLQDYRTPLRKLELNNPIKFLSSKNTQSLHDAVLLDKNIDVRDILYSSNRRMLAEFLDKDRRNVITFLEKFVFENRKLVSTSGEINKTDLVALNVEHVKTELNTIKYQKNVNALTQKVNKLKKQIYKRYDDDTTHVIDLKIHLVALDVGMELMQKEIAGKNKTYENVHLPSLISKVNETKLNIIQIINSTEEHSGNINEFVKKISKIRDTCIVSVTRLNRFVSDMDWIYPLSEAVFSKEIDLFSVFPLNYNGTYLNREYKYSTDILNIDDTIKPEVIYLIAKLLGTPYKSPDVILNTVLKRQNYIKELKCMTNPIRRPCLENLTAEHFKEQDKFIENSCTEFSSLIHSTKTNEILSAPSKMRRNVELWLEMPFKKDISETRLVDGKTYKEYEMEYKKYLKCIK